MLALLYLLIVFILGDAICRRFFAFVSTPHRLATAFLSGLLISSWWTYLSAWLFAKTSSPMLWGNLVFFITAIAAIILLRRLPAEHLPTTEIDRESTRFKKWDWIFTGVFLVFVCWLMFSTLAMNDGNVRIANHQSSDFGSTVSIMQTFAQGHNFPTEYPHFSGDRIRYHFLFYFAAGNLEYLGLSPAFSNNLLSILSLMSMLILVMTLGAVLYASRVVGRIGAALFFFHGSLAFITFYLANGSLSAVWNKLGTMKDFLSSGLPYRGEDWGVWSQVVYLNQRHLSSSIGIFLIVLVFLAIRHREKIEREPAIAAVEPPADTEVEDSEAETDDFRSETGVEYVPGETELEVKDASETEFEIDEPETETEPDGEPPQLQIEPDPEPQVGWIERFSPFVIAGVLLGLLPMWNGAVFAGTAAVLALMFIFLPLRREMLAIAIASALVALPQVIFLKTGTLRTPEYSFFIFGYTIPDATIFKVLYYLAFTFGFKWILIGIALVFGSRLQRLMILAFTSLILIAVSFQFSEELLANHKFFNIWLVLMNIPVGFGLVKLWNLIPGKAVIAGRALAIVLAFLITIGGVMDLFAIKNSFWVEYKYDGDRLVEWVKANTDPRSIFLSHRYVNHGILLAGRRLFYGHPYYAWTAGYPTSERDLIYRKMFESQNAAEVFRLLKENRINYVAVDNQVRKGDFIKKPNEKIFEAYFQTVFIDTENKYDGLKIYAVPDVLGEPKPGVELTPDISLANAESIGAFTGGEGNGFGQFSKPRGIAADVKGNIYIADTGNGRIQKFDADGKFVTAFGTTGVGQGEMKEPNGVAVDTAGNIYTVDAANGKLMKFGPDGKFAKEWKGPAPGFYGPRDIAIGPNKLLYIVDQGRTRIVRFDPATEVFGEWGTPGAGEGQFLESTGIAIGGGFVFVADAGNNRIQVFDMDGKFIRQWEILVWEKYPWHYPDAAYDEQAKRLYVTNGLRDEVLAFDLQGNPVDGGFKPEGDDKLGNPSLLAISELNKKRRLLVLNTGSSKVSAFELETNKPK